MKHRWVERVLVTLMVIGAPLWGMPSDAPESPSALYKAYWGVDTNLDGWASPEELVKHVAGLMEWTTYQDNNYVLNPLEFVEKGGGDCDDYALTKRQRLMTAGYPWEDLLLTECSTETGGRHLVLTVRTNKGDFILDNRYAYPLPWDALLYTWHKIKNHNSPTGWISCG
jgi:hypothetical protein